METHSKKQTKVKCSDCHKCSKDPVLGHFKCIRHRACSGHQNWQPEECDLCILFRHNSREWQDEKRDESFDALYKMLEETATELSNDEVTWEFLDTLNSFFNVQESQTDHIKDGEIIDSDETREGETDEGGEPLPVESLPDTNQPQSLPPTTNDLLHILIDKVQDLSVAIRPTVFRTQSQDDSQNSRARKRRQSQSPRRSENEADDPEYGSDSHRYGYHRRSPSPDTLRNRTKRRRNDYFEEGSNIYFYTDNHRRVGNRVWFNGQLRDAKWHPTEDAFSLLNSATTETPYMSSIQAHESLVSHFRTTQDPTDKPGLNRRSYRVHFDDTTGFAHALRLIKQETPDALHHLYTNDLTSFWKLFTNSSFKTSTMINFSSGWILTDQKYLDWAKNEKLTTRVFSREVSLSYYPLIPSKYLEEELRARSRVVDSLTGLGMLDSLAKEVKSNVTVHTSVEAIARHYLSVLSEATLRWYVAKMDVRKIVLQGSKAPQAVELMESNMWDPDIFGKDVVQRIVDKDVPTVGIEKRLGLSWYLNEYYKSNPTSVTPDRLGKLPISTKTDSTADQFFHQQTGRPRNFNTNQSAGQFNKGKQGYNNVIGRGAQTQNKGGNANQRTKQVSGNKKNWNPTNRKPNGQSNATRGPKGHKAPQQ